jgi:hypothetical protein
VKGWQVRVVDDQGNSFSFAETGPGTYSSNPSVFRGIPGRRYTLKLRASGASSLSYESLPMELKPVPPIDSLYYEKKTIRMPVIGSKPDEGAQVYLDTHDPDNECRFYRWEFNETWEFRLPFDVPKNRCWLSYNSGTINVKSTTALAEDRVSRFPVNFISNSSDRLKVKYSMLVNQYSLSEEEFTYWDKLQKVTEQVGGLYDIIPSSIPSNIWCVEDPTQPVLGYFSVSAVKSERIFIKEYFEGQPNLYRDCISDTLPGTGNIPGLGVSVWVVVTLNETMPPLRVVTNIQGCADCTVRGSDVQPLFWNDDIQAIDRRRDEEY